MLNAYSTEKGKQFNCSYSINVITKVNILAHTLLHAHTS